MESLSLNLSLFFEAINDVLVSPTNLMRETLVLLWTHCSHKSTCPTYLHRAVFASRLQPQHSQRFRHNHSLFLVIWWRHTFKEFKSLKSSCTSGTLVGSHTPNGAVEDFRGSTVMEGAWFFRVYNMAFVEEVVVSKLVVQYKSRSPKTWIALEISTYFVTKEATGNVYFLASNHYNFLSRENLLGDDRGQSTKEVSLAINDDGCRRKGGHCRDLHVLKIQFFVMIQKNSGGQTYWDII